MSIQLCTTCPERYECVFTASDLSRFMAFRDWACFWNLRVHAIFAARYQGTCWQGDCSPDLRLSDCGAPVLIKSSHFLSSGSSLSFRRQVVISLVLSHLQVESCYLVRSQEGVMKYILAFSTPGVLLTLQSWPMAGGYRRHALSFYRIEPCLCPADYQVSIDSCYTGSSHVVLNSPRMPTVLRVAFLSFDVLVGGKERRWTAYFSRPKVRELNSQCISFLSMLSRPIIVSLLFTIHIFSQWAPPAHHQCHHKNKYWCKFLILYNCSFHLHKANHWDRLASFCV
jgi:hypothetical protein